MADFTDILKRFGFVTVIEPKFYELKKANGDNITYQMIKDDITQFNLAEKAVPKSGVLLYPAKVALDSLRVSNITQEGPTKSAKGGLHAKTQMRYGKTMRLEMEDVVGRIDVLENLMGAELKTNELLVTDKFAVAMRIIGRTFIIDSATGDKKWVEIHFPKFLPDSIFDLTLEAEGDFGAMNIGGELIPSECGLFYELRAGIDPCVVAP